MIRNSTQSAAARCSIAAVAGRLAFRNGTETVDVTVDKGGDGLGLRVAGSRVDRNAGLAWGKFETRCTFPAEPGLASALPSRGGSLAG